MTGGASRDTPTDGTADEGGTISSDEGGTISCEPAAGYRPAPAGQVELRLTQALGRASSPHGRTDELREAVANFVAHEKARQREPDAVLRALRNHVWRDAFFHTEHPAFPALVAHVFRMASEEDEGEE